MFNSQKHHNICRWAEAASYSSSSRISRPSMDLLPPSPKLTCCSTSSSSKEGWCPPPPPTPSPCRTSMAAWVNWVPLGSPCSHLQPSGELHSPFKTPNQQDPPSRICQTNWFRLTYRIANWCQFSNDPGDSPATYPACAPTTPEKARLVPVHQQTKRVSIISIIWFPKIMISESVTNQHTYQSTYWPG